MPWCTYVTTGLQFFFYLVQKRINHKGRYINKRLTYSINLVENTGLNPLVPYWNTGRRISSGSTTGVISRLEQKAE